MDIQPKKLPRSKGWNYIHEKAPLDGERVLVFDEEDEEVYIRIFDESKRYWREDITEFCVSSIDDCPFWHEITKPSLEYIYYTIGRYSR